MKNKIILGVTFGAVALISVGATVATFLLTKGKKPDIVWNDDDVKVDDSLPNKKSDDNPKVIKDNDDIEIPKLEEKQLIDWQEIFPNISSEEYYDKLNFKNGQAWIDEEMITYITKDVLNRMTNIDGETYFAYKIVDDQKVLISFKWENEKQKTFVTYQISTNKL
ncbi:hypothetical protein FJO69_01915 [[Mycoplasma] falconis]|uniref:Uncharacterized protein n=1 Tax=[Mycoplasma] falconis TaxID=92403 RepID=A0A501XA19_9BACT|nr:hypothetical protein [[Mycoplasma] falconis]TPE57362.1 hypothetical protein FJO69_01915 [[Mycoplasma] falconis]